jgi:hypothetical protein
LTVRACDCAQGSSDESAGFGFREREKIAQLPKLLGRCPGESRGPPVRHLQYFGEWQSCAKGFVAGSAEGWTPAFAGEIKTRMPGKSVEGIPSESLYKLFRLDGGYHLWLRGDTRSYRRRADGSFTQ